MRFSTAPLLTKSEIADSVDCSPEDIERVKEVVRHLSKEKVRLPSGGNFSVLRFRQLGIYFGFHGLYVEQLDGLRHPTDCRQRR